MNRLTIYGILLLMLLLVGCSQIPNELISAEKLLETAPDSALHILQRLNPAQYETDEHKALYGLLYIQALDKKQLPLKPDSLLHFSIDYYQKHANEDKLATCYLYKGRSCIADLEYENAIGYYLKALDILDKKENHLLSGRIYSDLGDIFVMQREYGLARKKFILSYNCFQKIKRQDFAYYSYIDIGKTYYYEGKYTKAQSYFNKIYAQAKDSMIQGAVMHEIALTFCKTAQTDSALFYMRKLLHYPSIGSNRSVWYYYLANLFFDMNKLDSAFIYANDAFKFGPDIRTQRECYRILTNTEYLRGNMKEMSANMNKYVLLGDSLRKIDAQTKGSILETLHDTSIKANKTQRKIVYLISFILLVLISSYLLYRHLHTRSNKEKIRLETEKEKLEYENNRLEEDKILIEGTHNEQKADIRKDILHRYRQNLILKIQAKKNEQDSIRKTASHAQKEALDRTLYTELLYLDNTALFYREMDTVLNGMVDRLLSHSPALSEKEICWCCLFLLGVPTIDIYMLLHYQVDSLKKMRQRLATKFNLQGVTALDAFLLAMLSEE